MKQLENDTNLPRYDRCAALLMEVVPLIMRVIRAEIRGVAEMSVPQFRAMGFLSRHPGTPLSGLAEHIGLTMPTMSKMIDGLVDRQLVTRQSSSSDRRRIELALTPEGLALLESVRGHISVRLSEKLRSLPEQSLIAINRSLGELRSAFTLPGEVGIGTEG